MSNNDIVKIDIDNWIHDATWAEVVKDIAQSIDQLGIKAKVYQYNGVRIAFEKQDDLNLCMLSGIIVKQNVMLELTDEKFYDYVKQ
jgi:hypothetical protein